MSNYAGVLLDWTRIALAVSGFSITLSRLRMRVYWSKARGVRRQPKNPLGTLPDMIIKMRWVVRIRYGKTDAARDVRQGNARASTTASGSSEQRRRMVDPHVQPRAVAAAHVSSPITWVRSAPAVGRSILSSAVVFAIYYV